MKRRAYTAEQRAWLEENWQRLTNAEVAEAFTEEFGEEMTYGQARSYGKNHRVRKHPGVKARSLKAGSVWTPEVDGWFREYAAEHGYSEVRDEAKRLFGIDLTQPAVSNRRIALGVKCSAHRGFKKGNVPANKGMSLEEFATPEQIERMKANWFKPGNKPANWRARKVGDERVDEEGYTRIKAYDDRPNGRNYVLKHRHVYEQHHGPIPEGTVIVFADGDKTNFDVGNLVAVPRDRWAVINNQGIPYWDRESLECASMIAGIKVEARRLERKGRERQ